MVEFFHPQNTYTEELTKELSKRASVTVASKHGAPTPENGAEWKDIVFEGYMGKVKTALLYPLSLAKIAKEVVTGKYDVLHTQFLKKPEIEIPFYLHLKRLCGRYVHTVHNVIPHEPKDGDKEMFSKFYKECDALIVHNEFVRNILVEEYGIAPNRVHTMPIGVYHVPEQDPGYPKPYGPIRFLMLGMVRQYKGIDLAIEAVSLLPQEVRKMVQVDVIGQQERKIDPTDYKAMAKAYGVEDNFHFILEHVPDETLPSIYKETDICLLPYKNINGSAALRMAYAYGKPSIVSDLGVMKEDTENGATAMIFKSEDSADLARCITECVGWKPADYQRMRQNMERMEKEYLNWENAADKLMEAYKATICMPCATFEKNMVKTKVALVARKRRLFDGRP